MYCEVIDNHGHTDKHGSLVVIMMRCMLLRCMLRLVLRLVLSMRRSRMAVLADVGDADETDQTKDGQIDGGLKLRDVR